MYYFIGASLTLTILLASAIVLASALTGIWRMAAPSCMKLKPDT